MAGNRRRTTQNTAKATVPMIPYRMSVVLRGAHSATSSAVVGTEDGAAVGESSMVRVGSSHDGRRRSISLAHERADGKFSRRVGRLFCRFRFDSAQPCVLVRFAACFASAFAHGSERFGSPHNKRTGRDLSHRIPSENSNDRFSTNNKMSFRQ